VILVKEAATELFEGYLNRDLKVSFRVNAGNPFRAPAGNLQINAAASFIIGYGSKMMLI